jgi:hypothetical protein
MRSRMRAVHRTIEDFVEQRLQFRLPRHAHRVVLQRWNSVGDAARLSSGPTLTPSDRATASARSSGMSRLSSSHCQRPRMAPTCCSACVRRSPSSSVGVEVGVARVQRQLAAQEAAQCVAQAQLAGDRQFDVDAFDAVAVIAHARQRDHHVLVDLEGVGVACDGGGAGAIEPEVLRDSADTAMKPSAPRWLHRRTTSDAAGHDRRFVVADDVADQHHLGAAVAARLGGVADRRT